MASLAGAWVALVTGFGGLRDTEGELSFDPQLPPDISRLCFTLRWRNCRLRVEITGEEATYSLRDGTTGVLTFRHGDETLTLHAGDSVIRKIAKRTPLLPRPSQPVGREPIHRPSNRG
jgi:trehalose/maltose hydrolase-like predicted phosphorylase